MRNKISRFAPVAVCFAFVACGTSSGENTADAIANVKANCGGMTIAEVAAQNGISAACKQAVQALLPAPSGNLLNRILPFADDQSGTTRDVYLGLQDKDGVALTAAQVGAGLKISTITNGVETALPTTGYFLTQIKDITTGLVSLSMVTDYSGSMTDSDIADANTIANDVVGQTVLPFELEAFLFSDTVKKVQDFTSDKTTQQSAIAVDKAYTRGATALYDGMGTALTEIIQRPRPLRILMVMTDGLENASAAYKRDQLLKTVNGSNVFVVMLGSLFSDANEMQALAGTKGVYMYEKTVLAFGDNVKRFVNVLNAGWKISLPASAKGTKNLKVTMGAQTQIF